MIKTLLLTPWFGQLPEWIDQYSNNIGHLQDYGYDWLLTQDIDLLSTRIREVLGVNPQLIPGTSQVHNYRTAYGVLFAQELKNYDFWGITDLDCVYGNISHFAPDLTNLDIWSNHHNYICGPWTLFRNTERVNNLFRLVPDWQSFMTNQQSQPGRWTEVEYSQIVDQEHDSESIKRLYTHYQGKDPNDDSEISFENGILTQHREEIMTFHFNRHKRWPLS